MGPGFFDLHNRYQELSRGKDPLLKLNDLISWENFRPIILEALKRKPAAIPSKGRPPFDPIILFKMLVLQTLYTLSDQQTEFQCKDRLSFMRFLGVHLYNKVPDEKTLWLFRETLVNASAMEPLFEMLERFISSQGFEAKKGQMVDASIVEAPKRRLTRAENKDLEEGKIPQSLENDHVRAQVDLDASWTKRQDRSYFGYKNHINADVKHKIIRLYSVTDAASHDSTKTENLIDLKNPSPFFYGDSAYNGKDHRKMLKDQCLQPRICMKGKVNHPLAVWQQSHNRKVAHVRARVEHVFGRESQFGGKAMFVRTIGLARASLKIGLINLVYNMQRYVFLTQQVLCSQKKNTLLAA